jgi:hypothetical protein
MAAFSFLVTGERILIALLLRRSVHRSELPGSFLTTKAGRHQVTQGLYASFYCFPGTYFVARSQGGK